MLGIWDPYIGWDLYRIRGIILGLIFLSLLAMFVAGTEGLPWYYPFESIWNWGAAHTTGVITFFIFVCIALFWYWKFQSGGL